MEIEAEGLRKIYPSKAGPVEALDGVDLRVARGKIFGFLGPNGAGKTTVIRILVTLSRPTSGTARVAGFDVVGQPRQVRSHIGYVSQAGGVDGGMTGRANLLLQAGLQGMSKADAVARVGELAGRFSLEEVLDRPAATLSGGLSRRLALAMGLVHRPSVVFLDEPTLGLDPSARVELWQEIGALSAEGATVFLTTHYLEEADTLCDELAIIDHGRIVSQDSPAALKQQVADGEVVSVTVSHGHGGSDEVREEAEALPGVRRVWWEGDVLRVAVTDGSEAMPQLLRRLDAGPVSVRSVALSAPSLDDVFLHKTGRTLRGVDSAGNGSRGGHAGNAGGTRKEEGLEDSGNPDADQLQGA